ncbi:cell envelope biogenesis protein OmpA [Bacteroidia bacterium]|nr:cell envelope biogenesis protein OmpA [Bacteroidia bacterium]GHV44664.1 cell envelope biogenesis protein OmpA [Bacteroidia bacterium]
MKKIFSFIIIFATVCSGCGIQKRIKKADERFALGEYYKSANMYRTIYRRISAKDKTLRGQIAFKQAEAYRLINSPRAELAYQNAVRYNYPDTLLYFRYAEVLQWHGKYAEAAKNYQKFLSEHPAHREAENGLQAAQLAAEWAATPSRFKISEMKIFNGRRTDNFSPAFTSNAADALVFSSMRQERDKKLKKKIKLNQVNGLPFSKLYISKKNAKGEWEEPELLEGAVNSVNTDDGAACFSSDGKTMYFTRAEQFANEDAPTIIMMSQRGGGAWGEPQKLNIFADSTVSVGHPAIAPDDATLYFVADAPDGFGGKDIWRGKVEGTDVKYIENLGNQINTKQDEMFPAVAPDGTLYFSSNGLPGIGGLDLFKAVENRDSLTWTVESMGLPFNSRNDDFGLTLSKNGLSGFFTSSRTKSTALATPNDLIYGWELSEMTFVVAGKVTNESGEPIGEATVRMVGNDGTNARVQTKKDGTYRLKLSKNVDYVMLATARGYLNQKQDLTTQGIDNDKTFDKNFNLSSIFKSITLDNIFYEFAKWNLTPESENGLRALVKILDDNPNIAIELSAHTDYVGNNIANIELSAKRAQSVVNYLIGAGVAPARLAAVGYGEERPVIVDAALAKKYSFLRDGDVLTEDFILTLAPDQQQAANQINRRTEFKVTSTTYGIY